MIEYENVIDDVWHEIFNKVETKSLMSLFLANRAFAQKFNQEHWLIPSIINHITANISEPGQCQYPFPIVIGTQTNPNMAAPISQQHILSNALISYFKQNPQNLAELKEIYQGLNLHSRILKEFIIPALFLNSTTSEQQRAFREIASISNNHPTFANFMMGFSKFMHKNIDAKGEYNQTALTNRVYRGDIMAVKFLIENGAEPSLLDPKAQPIYLRMLADPNMEELTRSMSMLTLGNKNTLKSFK